MDKDYNPLVSDATLLDMFAVEAMDALIKVHNDKWTSVEVAIEAYNVALAMLERRKELGV